MPSRNEWMTKLGAKRRAIDKALLAELERQIASPDRAPCAPKATQVAENSERLSAAARTAIALAFGRPMN